MPVRNLTLYDILAHAIPGSLFLILLWPSVAVLVSILGPEDGVYSVLLGDATLAIVFLLLSYVVGGLIQGISEGPVIGIKEPILGIERRTSKVPVLNRVVGKATAALSAIRVPSIKQFSWAYDRKFVDLRRYSSRDLDQPFQAQIRARYEYDRTTRSFVEICERVFDVRLYETGADGTIEWNGGALGRLYWLVQSYLFTRDIDRAQRWLLLGKFYRGMWAAFLLSVLLNTLVLAGFALVVTTGFVSGEIAVSTLVLFGIDIGFAAFGSIVVHRERRKYDRYWGSALIDDFYTSVVGPSGSADTDDRVRTER